MSTTRIMQLTTDLEIKSELPTISGHDIKEAIEAYKELKNFFKLAIKLYSEGFKNLNIFYSQLDDKNAVLNPTQLCDLVKILSWAPINPEYCDAPAKFEKHLSLTIKTQNIFFKLQNKFDQKIWPHLCAVARTGDLQPDDLQAFYAHRQHASVLANALCYLNVRRYFPSPKIRSLLHALPAVADQIARAYIKLYGFVPEKSFILCVQQDPNDLCNLVNKIQFIDKFIVWNFTRYVIFETLNDFKEEIDSLYRGFKIIEKKPYIETGMNVCRGKISKQYKNFALAMCRNADIAFEIAEEFLATRQLEDNHPRKQQPTTFIASIRQRQEQESKEAMELYNVTVESIVKTEPALPFSSSLINIICNYAKSYETSLFTKKHKEKLLGIELLPITFKMKV